MVFNITFNNISVISWLSILLVEEIGYHIMMYQVQLSLHISVKSYESGTNGKCHGHKPPSPHTHTL